MSSADSTQTGFDDERIDLTLHDGLLRKPTAELVLPDAERPDLRQRRVYEKLKVLGAGAMGEVHLVKDALLRRDVAYKQLIASEKVSMDDERRFVSEVQITAQLDHPFIVPIYSLEVTERGPAYTMKRIAGEDLKDWLKRLKAEPEQINARYRAEHDLLLETFLKVLDAMAFAHSKGILHRDLKPANLMIGPYHEVYIMDWGIARPFGPAAEDYYFEPQEKGKVIGTPRYMSPEQVRGANHQLDDRSDLFALGLILFEVLTLKPAYTAANTSALLDKVRQAQIEPFEPLHNLSIARELQAIVRKATALKRAHRYENVKAMADDIRRYLNGEAILAEPDNRLQKVVRQFKRYRTQALGVLLVVVSLSAVFTVYNLWQRQQALQQAQAHELQLTQLYGRVISQSQQVDRQLLGSQRALQILAGHSVQAIQHGLPLEAPYYIENREIQPPFYEQVPNPFYSTHYRNKLSIDATAFSVAYQLPVEQVKTQLQTINALTPIHPQIMQNTLTGGAPYQGDVKKLLAEEGSPLMYTNIVSKEGVYQYFPAIQYNTPNYDPRQRPFYLQALGKREVQCSKAYLDRMVGSLLPCSLSIYGDQGQFLGVVSLDMQFNYLARKLLQIDHLPAIRDTYLLNKQGEIIVKASDKNQKITTQAKVHTGYALQKLESPEQQAARQRLSQQLAKASTAEKAILELQLAQLDQQPVVSGVREQMQQAIAKQQRVGILESDKAILIFFQLNFQGWYFVAEVDPQLLYTGS